MKKNSFQEQFILSTGNNCSVGSHSNPSGGNLQRGGSVGGVSFPHGKDPCEGVERVGRLPSTQTKILS